MDQENQEKFYNEEELRDLIKNDTEKFFDLRNKGNDYLAHYGFPSLRGNNIALQTLVALSKFSIKKAVKFYSKKKLRKKLGDVVDEYEVYEKIKKLLCKLIKDFLDNCEFDENYCFHSADVDHFRIEREYFSETLSGFITIFLIVDSNRLIERDLDAELENI